MVKVIIHAGLPKTGSSSVQVGFAENRALLAEHGFFYPQLDPLEIPGHWALGALWQDRMAPETEAHLLRRLTRMGPPQKTRADVESILHETIRRAKAWGGQGIVLLSDEHLSYENAREGCRRLAALCLGEGCSFEVLAYARPDPELFCSHIQQQLKTFGRRLPMRNMRHAPMATALFDNFVGRVRLRVYSRAALQDGDAVVDLCGWIAEVAGRPLPDLGPVRRANESIPAPGCALMQHLSDRGEGAADEQDFGMLRWSMIHSHLPAPRLTLPEGWEARITAQGHAAWNAMLARTEYGPEVQARFRMAELPPAAPLAVDEIRAWVGAQWDQDYSQRLRAWIAARSEPWVERALAFLDRSSAPLAPLRVLFHAGANKTGSTTIQASLAGNREVLTRDGFIYPTFSPVFADEHWALAAVGDRVLDGYLARRAQMDGRADLRGAVRGILAQALAAARAGDGTVILSTESLGKDRETMEVLRDLIAADAAEVHIAADAAEARVLIYIRPVRDFLASHVQHRLHAGLVPILPPPDMHVARVAALVSAFGRASVTVRLFSRQYLVGGDVVQDFLQWAALAAGRPLPVIAPAPNVNEAAPAESCAVLVRLQDGAVPPSAADYAAIVGFLRRMRPLVAGRKLVLPEDLARRALLACGPAWNEALGMIDLDPARKADLLAPDGKAEPLTEPELRAWVASYWDADFLQRLYDLALPDDPGVLALRRAFAAGIAG